MLDLLIRLRDSGAYVMIGTAASANSFIGMTSGVITEVNGAYVTVNERHSHKIPGTRTVFIPLAQIAQITDVA